MLGLEWCRVELLVACGPLHAGNDGSCDTWMLRLCPHPSRQKVLTTYIGCTYARVDHAVDGVEDGNLVSQRHAWPGVTV